MMKRILPILLPVIVLLVVGFGGVFGLQKIKPVPEEATEEPRGLTVFAERVTLEDLDLTVKVQGEVRPRRQIVVAPQIQGRISWIADNFIDGGLIRKNQKLVQLEADDFELAVIRAQSSVASAEQRLLREQAEAEIALQDIQELGLNNTSPLARREPQLAEARAALSAAQAQLMEAELALKRTAVYAPFDGRVRAKSVDVGQFVAPGQSLGTIFATDVVEVLLPITDEQLGILGLPLAFNETRETPAPEVVFSGKVGGKERNWKGKIVRTGAAVNSQTRLISAIGELRDPYGEGADDGAPMAPGLFVEATISGETIEGVYRAPRAALRGDDRVFLGDRDEGVLRIKQVTVVHSDPTGVYMSDGVDVDDLLIVSAVQGANDGISVEVFEKGADGELIPPPERKKPRKTKPDSDAALVSGENSNSEDTSE